MKYVFLLLLSIFLIGATPVYAQFNKSLDPSVSITLNPENPKANETVVASVTSFSTDLNNATITWRINGKNIASGKGVQSTRFTTGNPGSSLTLSISVLTAEGTTINSSYTLKASSIDLIWQSQTYTPPFYKGKALFSHESVVTFIALPHIMSRGQEINPKKLTYTWTKNGTVLGDYSGYGKNTYSMLGSVISIPIEIEVTATSDQTGDNVTESTTVNPIDPVVAIYEKNPLYGIQFQKSLSDNVALQQKEVQLIPIPFYFSSQNPNTQNITYTWAINGNQINSDTTQNIQNFRSPDGSSGVSNISLQIGNTLKALQYASQDFNIRFNSSASKNSGI